MNEWMSEFTQKLCSSAHSKLYLYMNLPPEMTERDKTGDKNLISSHCSNTNERWLWPIYMTYGIAAEMGGKNDRTHNRVNAERENEREKEK